MLNLPCANFDKMPSKSDECDWPCALDVRQSVLHSVDKITINKFLTRRSESRLCCCLVSGQICQCARVCANFIELGIKTTRTARASPAINFATFCDCAEIAIRFARRINNLKIVCWPVLAGADQLATRCICTQIQIHKLYKQNRTQKANKIVGGLCQCWAT